MPSVQDKGAIWMPNANQAIRLPKTKPTCILTGARLDHFGRFFPDRCLPRTFPMLMRGSNWPLQKRTRKLLVIAVDGGRLRLEAKH